MTDIHVPGWNEAMHPRHPRGSREGGRFKPGDKISGTLVVSPKTKVTGEVVAVRPTGLLVKTDNGEERMVSEQSAEHVGSSGLLSSGDTIPGVSLTAAQFTERERERLAKSGAAMSDGSFPIRNRTDLRHALRALGRAKDRAAAKRHIVKRARALGATDMLPDGYGVTASSTPGKRDAMVATAKQAKIEKVMSEFKAGTLKSSSGEVVTDRKQALAIAMSMAKNLTAANWDESKHPRDPGGEGGGRWVPKGTSSADDSGTDRPVDTAHMDDLEARVQAYIAKGWEPADGEPGEWIDMRNPKTNESVILDVNDEYDGQVADEEMGTDLQAQDERAAELYDMENQGVPGLPPGSEEGGWNNYDEIYDEIDNTMYTIGMEPEFKGLLDAWEMGNDASVLQNQQIKSYLDDMAYGERGYEDIYGKEYADAWRAAADEAIRRRRGGQQASALTAAAAGLAPLKPSKSWFEKPKLDGPTPLQVTADGRIFGHAALWGTCHTGISGTCRQPPRSQSDYAYFHLGELETEEGDRVHVGRVTMNTGHAPLTASRDQTVRHYDDTGTVAAHVRAYDDDHGIVLAGAVQPDLSERDARTLRGAPVSGDWRSIGGKLEMVGMLAVNVPGFPVPRAMAASMIVEDESHTMSMVAAGMYVDPKDEERKLKALTARAKGVEGLYAAAMGGTDSERRMRGVAASAVPGPASPGPS